MGCTIAVNVYYGMFILHAETVRIYGVLCNISIYKIIQFVR